MSCSFQNRSLQGTSLRRSALYLRRHAGDGHPRRGAVYRWLSAQGHEVSSRQKTKRRNLTVRQLLWQVQGLTSRRCASPMSFGCESIGIQYQQGLKDLLPASDLVEGILNNSDRPPVRNGKGQVIPRGPARSRISTRWTSARGSNGVFTNRVHRRARPAGREHAGTICAGAIGIGAARRRSMCGCFLISGRRAAPPASHRRLSRHRLAPPAPDVFSALGGGTVRGIAKPGENIVWSRVFVEGGQTQDGSRPRQGHQAPARGDRAPMEGDHDAMADQCTRVHLRPSRATRLMARHKGESYPGSPTRNRRRPADLALYTKAALARRRGSGSR